jgi:hypothetical protein
MSLALTQAEGRRSSTMWGQQRKHGLLQAVAARCSQHLMNTSVATRRESAQLTPLLGVKKRSEASDSCRKRDTVQTQRGFSKPAHEAKPMHRADCVDKKTGDVAQAATALRGGQGAVARQVPAEQPHMRTCQALAFTRERRSHHVGHAIKAGGTRRSSQSGVDEQSIVSPHISDAPAGPSDSSENPSTGRWRCWE